MLNKGLKRYGRFDREGRGRMKPDISFPGWDKRMLWDECERYSKQIKDRLVEVTDDWECLSFYATADGMDLFYEKDRWRSPDVIADVENWAVKGTIDDIPDK
jgi:hypothetical protein